MNRREKYQAMQKANAELATISKAVEKAVREINKAAFIGATRHVRRARVGMYSFADAMAFDMALGVLQPWQVMYLLQLKNHSEL